MFVAAIPHKETGECCKIIENIIGIKTTPLPNYLNITLTPSNPILHTTRLRNLYGDWKKGVVYKKVPLFMKTGITKRQSFLSPVIQRFSSYARRCRLTYPM